MKDLKGKCRAALKIFLKSSLRINGFFIFLILKGFDLSWYFIIRPCINKQRAVHNGKIKRATSQKMLEEVAKAEKPGDLLSAVKKMNRDRREHYARKDTNS